MLSFNNCTFYCNNTECSEDYWASFEEKSFSKGRYFKVYRGVLNGRRQSSCSWCVVKVFRRCKPAETQNLCHNEVKKCLVVKELATKFNELKIAGIPRIKFVELFSAQMDEVSVLKLLFCTGSRKLSNSDSVLIEKDLSVDEVNPNRRRQMTRFIDSRGKTKKSVDQYLVAFTHFTFHQTGGKLIVCDLSGVRDNKGFYLKTPVIHSRGQDYGSMDRGDQGIHEFFSNHVCNDICKSMMKTLAVINLCPTDNRQPASASGQKRRMSQDDNNAIDSPQDNPGTCKSASSWKTTHDFSLEDGSCTSSHTSSMSQFSQPSAPPAIDREETSFRPTFPPYSFESVAKELLLEQQGTDCILCIHNKPISSPILAPNHRRSDTSTATIGPESCQESSLNGRKDDVEQTVSCLPWQCCNRHGYCPYSSNAPMSGFACPISFRDGNASEFCIHDMFRFPIANQPFPTNPPSYEDSQIAANKIVD